MPRPKKHHLTRRPDGRFCCWYHGKAFYGRTEEEAYAARDDFKVLEGAPRADMYFSAYAAQWLTAYKSHLTNKAYNKHVRIANKFMSVIGDHLLTEYTQTDIARFYQEFNGMSAASASDAKNTIKGIFSAAQIDGIININPAAAIRPPKGTKGTHRAITPEERQLIHALDHRLRPAVMVMLYAGLRRGEAVALNVPRDVDFKAKTLTVREAIRFEGNRPVIVDPKTSAGFRTIPLLDNLAAELRGIKGLLCTDAHGAMMSETAFNRAWESYIYRLSLLNNAPVNIRPHDLRHSFCTMLYDAGVDVKTAMLWMGHSNEAMTMRIYTHLSAQRRTESENALRNAAKNIETSQNTSQRFLVMPETIVK